MDGAGTLAPSGLLFHRCSSRLGLPLVRIDRHAAAGASGGVPSWNIDLNWLRSSGESLCLCA
ncbi:hypothetical protein LMG24235_05851 [Paraburkholderia sabiae]|nr:hypothetical protein LMG24235_05851 [Paraburkholderia sabiae]CAG9200234.1 hypothetical protein PSAB6_210110 [Paraburkholderia sabiae]